MSLYPLLKKDLSAASLSALKTSVDLISSKDNILICAHAAPDGDALGSTSALAYICRTLGKKYILYNESIPAPFLDFIPMPQKLEHSLDTLDFQPELIICLDCGSRNRLGKEADKLLKLAPSINIDHHLGNPNYGSLANWVDASMASTGNAIAYIAFELDIPIVDELAFCIYTSLVTDTNSFSHGNTNARALMTAAHIVEMGLQPNRISNALNCGWSEDKTHLWAYLMSTYTYDKDLSIAYVLISQAILDEFNCTKDEIEGFIEQLRKIKDVRIACTLREAKALETKVSFRSSDEDNVQLLASYFNGGGHKNAAGASLDMPLAEARDTILKTLALHREDILP